MVCTLYSCFIFMIFAKPHLLPYSVCVNSIIRYLSPRVISTPECTRLPGWIKNSPYSNLTVVSASGKYVLFESEVCICIHISISVMASSQSAAKNGISTHPPPEYVEDLDSTILAVRSHLSWCSSTPVCLSFAEYFRT